jgi:hypothetical protein
MSPCQWKFGLSICGTAKLREGAEIGRLICVAVGGGSCCKVAPAEEGMPLGWGQSTRRLPAAAELQWLGLLDGHAHPARPMQASGVGVDVDGCPAMREHLWPCPVCEFSWPQSLQ